MAGRYFPAEGQSRRVFGSLGDTINNMTIDSEGTPAGEADDAFGSSTVIISTADKGIERRVRDALESAGYSMDIVNTDIIPQQLVKMGLEEDRYFRLHPSRGFLRGRAGG